jgi:RNA polymerase sigma factor (TIGR02999 family)
MRRVGVEIPKKIENFEKSFQLSDVTDILTRIEAGDGHAADELLPIVYDELRRLASQRLAREAPRNSLQTTELVHEAYLRLVQTEQHWEGSAHFFAAAAESMRRILVDRARARKRRKRGGDLRRVVLHDSAIKARDDTAADEILMVNELLDRLAEKHPEEAELVKLRYFADFSTKEAARAIGIPVSTAYHRWNFAQAWLRCELQKGERPEIE